MRKTRVLVAALLATAATLAGCSTEPPASNESPASSQPPASQESDFNQADVMFARGMVPHHEQAIEMADLVPRRTESQAMRDLAERIRSAQQPEIDRLNGWLRSWNAPEGKGDDRNQGEHQGGGHQMDGMDNEHQTGGEHQMSGMMSEEDMTALERSRGAEFDRMWLRMMVDHHRGAVDMARQELDSGRHQGAKSMARDIIRTQQDEIDQMNTMLG